MSAMANWQTGWDPQTHSSHPAWRELPVARLAVAYVLLVPLILFAVHGGFSFEHESWNSDLGAYGGKIAVVASESETLRDRVQAWVALAICLGAAAPYARSIFAAAQGLPLFWLLPLYALASAFWSQDAALSLRSGLSLLISTLFAFYLAERFSERQRLELIVLAGACVAAGSLALAVFLPQFGVDHQLHEGAWQGLFTQKNVCAEATLFLLTPALALPPLGRYGQLLRSAYIGICLLIIAMTQSKTGWAATLLYFAFFYGLRLLGRFGRKEGLPLAAVAFAMAAAAMAAVASYPAALLSLAARSGSLSGRTAIWGAILASVLRRPVGGYGFDAFWSLLHGEAARVFASTGWVVTSAHNGFLNLALELGLVGVALVIVTLLQACRHASAAFRPDHSPYVDWCIGIVFLTVVYNLDERTLMAPQYLPWILYIVACVGLRRAAFAPAAELSAAHVEEEWA
jgi:O-antigen ligase